MSTEKSLLRAEIRQARREKSAAERLHAKQRFSVPGFEIVMRQLDLMAPGGPHSVAGYSPLLGEPDVRGLLNRLIAVGVEVYLPVSTPQRPLEWAADDGRYRPSSVGGGPEPVGPVITSAELIDRAGVVIVPALAVDRRGARLGQGGGFYDRSFTELRTVTGSETCTFWAAVYDDEVLPARAVPTLPHDLRVDAALTPSGLDVFRKTRRGVGNASS
ncbi:5-formyltetrahydrofolate cyclo-ligase [Spelaeicoccus albus]|uniref:5-formyltetrahydrofolate cyclo-ligase n=2 Tax=Spelaeicoccus albus TaxID=1280376 RepID=A0A7Z0A949_9MICO|nr:5-formyltetrahydrofolate cyclo-ligase [Spelaeicoccus albus]